MSLDVPDCVLSCPVARSLPLGRGRTRLTIAGFETTHDSWLCNARHDIPVSASEHHERYTPEAAVFRRRLSSVIATDSPSVGSNASGDGVLLTDVCPGGGGGGIMAAAGELGSGGGSVPKCPGEKAWLTCPCC